MSRILLTLLGASAVGFATTAPGGAWVSTFHHLEGITAVRMNATGDVVAAGSPGVVKLRGSDGVTLWRAADVMAGGGGISEVGGPPIAIDGTGAVLAIGARLVSLPQGTSELEVTKLDGNTGAAAWTVDVSDWGPGAVAVDGADDVVVAGADLLGFGVLKLAGGDGSVLWQYGLGAGFAWTVAVDGQGNVFAAGTLPNTPSSSGLAVVKLDGATGAQLWRHIEYPGGAFAIALDSAGDVATAGGPVVKLSGADGSEQWHSAAPLTGVVSVVFDAAGDVVAAGSSTSLTGSVDFTVVKLAGDTGAERWSRALEGTTTDGNFNAAYQVAVDSTGDVLAAGYFRNLGNGPVVDEDFAVVKLDGASGDQVWRSEINGKDTSLDRALTLALDASDNVVAGGVLSDFSYDSVVVKMSERIPARKLVVSDPGDVVRRKLAVAATGSGLLVIPAETSAGDPTASGATLQLLNPSTGEQQTIPLPAPYWKRLGAKTAGHGYVYDDKAGIAGPCQSIVLKPSGLRASCHGALSFSLDEPSQGSLGVVLTTGDHAGKYCMLFGSPVRDVTGSFLSKSAPQPSACPMVP